MRVLVVYCHPVETSFVAAMRDAVLKGLEQAGHETRLIDLYAENFDPRFSAHEHAIYADAEVNQAGLETHIEHLKWAEGIVFVFPTWWYDMPAMLKGWLDRVWVPGVAFGLPPNGGMIRPKLHNIRLIAAVTSCGASWWWSKLVGEPHRRILMRGMRALCGRNCKQLWLGCYQMDSATSMKRGRYLETVRRRMARVV